MTPRINPMIKSKLLMKKQKTIEIRRTLAKKGDEEEIDPTEENIEEFLKQPEKALTEYSVEINAK